jgi:hypothetical protein
MSQNNQRAPRKHRHSYCLEGIKISKPTSPMDGSSPLSLQHTKERNQENRCQLKTVPQEY